MVPRRRSEEKRWETTGREGEKALLLNIRGGKCDFCCSRKKIPTDATRGGIKVGSKRENRAKKANKMSGMWTGRK